MKKSKKTEAHSMDMKYGMGTYNGVGVKQKVGRIRDSYVNPTFTKAQVGKPPKSLA